VKSIARLKDDARRHEQAGEWAQAISAYEQIIGAADGEPDAELPLYNRVGDLFVRMGKPDQAVPYYEDAADRYAEAGLYNNAMALCNKALRYVPEKAELFRKLGQFCAAQGFMTDARRWYGEFADTLIRQDSPDEAFRALEELAETSNDASDRAMLGRLLHAHGRTNDAVAHLARAHGQFRSAGELELAESLRSEILAIAPDADPALVPLEAAPAGPPRPATGSFELEELVDLVEPTGAHDSAVEPGDLAIEPTALDAGGRDSVAAHVSGLQTGFGPTGAGHSLDAGLLDGFESTALGDSDAQHAGAPAADVSGDDFVELPLLDLEAGLPEHAPSIDLGLDGFQPTIGTAGGTEGSSDTAHPDDGDIDIRLPLLEDEEPAPGVDSMHPPIPDDRLGTIPATGNSAFDLPLLDDDPLAQDEDDRGRGDDEFDLALIPVDPAPTEEESSARPRAAEGTGAAAAPDAAQPEPAPRDPAETTDGYVDLASLLNEPIPTRQTRFFVEEKEPTGDEDLDLADLLTQFREKVTDSIDPDDVGSHYDLGLAFKEMGLLDEAISQFQIALRTGDGRLRIFEELGQCFFLKGQYGIAQKVLERALELDTADEMELIGVYYYLGRAAEAKGHVERARDAYERVLALDLAFQDVGQRLSRL
jgi:tetratricopeptide (TPR) repeat protein